MSWFRNIRIARTKRLVVQQMTLMVKEAERVYRGFLELYAQEEGVAVRPTGEGLFKARFFTASFMVYAFLWRWPDELDAAGEVANIASGIAIAPLVPSNDVDAIAGRDSTGQPCLHPAVAESFALIFHSSVLKAIKNEFETGPSLPEHETAGFRELINLYHGTLKVSLGEEQYSQKMKMFGESAEKRFDHLIAGGVMATLRHLTEVHAQL